MTKRSLQVGFLLPSWVLIGFCILIMQTRLFAAAGAACPADGKILCFITHPKSENLNMYWKDGDGRIFGSFQNLQTWLHGRGETLVFAMNGGMFKPDKSPQGLYIEKSKVMAPLDTSSGSGNFYLKPNGVFYLTKDHVPVICKTSGFVDDGNIAYATQSGPMLLTGGKIHPAFKVGSSNVNIRNGVGILSDNTAVFAMSKEKVSLYEFAVFFKRMGCENALYLDGFVSQTYLPGKKWMQTGDGFAVIIGVSEKGK